MQLRKRENKNRKGQSLMIGSLLLIIASISLISFRYFENYLEKQDEKKQLKTFMEIVSNISTSEEQEETKTQYNQSTNDYIAVLEIPKINLLKGIYSKNSSLNNVNQNVKLLKEADMPDKINGNFILAGHSGTSRVSYFKNLNQLENEDKAYVYYHGKKYVYKLVNHYDIEKTGTAHITRNGQKTTLTLITCRFNTNQQIIYVFELLEVEA